MTDGSSGTTPDVAANLARVRAEVDAACVAAGRDPAEVRLLPVSKTHPPAVLEAAYAAGVRLFGENRVQEAAEKADHFADRPDVRWAMIGHLQSNKARQVAGFADELHALDSLKVARALHRGLDEAGRTLDVFVQVNSSAEPQKSGLAPGDVEGLLTELADLPTLKVRGLMTLAVLSDDEARRRRVLRPDGQAARRAPARAGRPRALHGDVRRLRPRHRPRRDDRTDRPGDLRRPGDTLI